MKQTISKSILATFASMILIGTVIGQNEVRYSAMDREQRRSFVRSEVSRLVKQQFAAANAKSSIDDEGVDRVIKQIDEYLARKKQAVGGGCRLGADLGTIFKRGRPHISTIRRSFDLAIVPPQIGIYLAMVESEFCPCLQSPTGPLGMYQFSRSTATVYGIDAVAGASPSKPDERCDVRMSSRGAALYIAKLIKEDFKDDPDEFLLAVAAYSLGEGGLRRLRRETGEATNGKQVGFWQISDFVMNKRAAWVAEKLKAATGDEEKDAALPSTTGGQAFTAETVKYIPRFLAAALIGENPRVFGIAGEKLSKSN